MSGNIAMTGKGYNRKTNEIGMDVAFMLILAAWKEKL